MIFDLFDTDTTGCKHILDRPVRNEFTFLTRSSLPNTNFLIPILSLTLFKNQQIKSFSKNFDWQLKIEYIRVSRVKSVCMWTKVRPGNPAFFP